MTEKEKQTTKEKAVLLALQQHNMALIRRDLEIHGIKKDGSSKLISISTDYGKLWSDALRVLKEKFI